MTRQQRYNRSEAGRARYRRYRETDKGHANERRVIAQLTFRRREAQIKRIEELLT